MSNSDSEALTSFDKKNRKTTKIDPKNQISQFRQAYIKDRKLINDLLVAKVAISVETLEQITFHKIDKIILENTPHGKYWIIRYSENYFLVPSEIQQIINAQGNIFNCSQTVISFIWILLTVLCSSFNQTLQ